jgi:hypothetical protein
MHGKDESVSAGSSFAEAAGQPGASWSGLSTAAKAEQLDPRDQLLELAEAGFR